MKPTVVIVAVYRNSRCTDLSCDPTQILDQLSVRRIAMIWFKLKSHTGLCASWPSLSRFAATGRGAAGEVGAKILAGVALGAGSDFFGGA